MNILSPAGGHYQIDWCSRGYAEERWIGIGWLHVMIGVVVYTERDEEVIRIISARKATKYEVRRYEQHIEN